MAKAKKRIIWSNRNLDFEDWRADLEEEYPDANENDLYEIMLERNNEYLDDERINLDIDLGHKILGIADLGLWYGRRSAYKEIRGNISACLDSDDDYIEWYVDERGDLCADGSHHDGNNHYMYRVYKDGVSERQIENLKSKIYYGKATRRDITRITRRLGDEIAKVYGW